MQQTEDTPPSSASPDVETQTSEAQESDYAFLVHSQDTLSQEVGPETTTQRLARQKRRRTSPEDHAILEAEYERNPKPDKAARIKIVGRVALGEKEVQIWFQNRRQMTRRKSRPLLPDEIFNLQSSQEQSDPPDSLSLSTRGDGNEWLPSSQSSILESQSKMEGTLKDPSGAAAEGVRSDYCTIPPPSAHDIVPTSPESAKYSIQEMNISTSEGKADNMKTRVAGLVRSLSQTDPVKRRTASFANRRSASFIIHAEHCDTTQSSAIPPINNAFTESNQATSSQFLSLKRTSSSIRLSLSLDGKAEVTTHTGTTPSPPRAQPIPSTFITSRPHTGLQRSYSAIEPTKGTGEETPVTPYSRHAVAGRSRDARTWEFYCDSDVRNALTEQAELQESGSATAAITLIRSHSNKAKAMTSNFNKRNVQPQILDSTKRLKADAQKSSKPKLGRASSSVARLQTTNGDTEKPMSSKDGRKHSKSNSQTAIFVDGDADSDKENWQPGTQTRNPPRRRPAKAHQAGGILEESHRVPSQSSSLDALMSREGNATRRASGKRASNTGQENEGLDLDDEIAAFIGESGSRELDCVQNLLSLSQAVWQ